MKPTSIFTLLAAFALSACSGGDERATAVSPDDYVHFSDYFTMDESTANEMSLAPPVSDMALAPKEPYANLLRDPQDPSDAAAVAAPSAP